MGKIKKMVTIKDIQLECMCGCGTKLFLGNGDDGEMYIGIQERGEKKRREVVVFDDIPKLIDFVETWR